jgi:hypothetical protein
MYPDFDDPDRVATPGDLPGDFEEEEVDVENNMPDFSDLVARKRVERWTGHGEGGQLVTVEICGWKPDDTYNSTDRDYEMCRLICEHVNKALTAYVSHVGNEP